MKAHCYGGYDCGDDDAVIMVMVVMLCSCSWSYRDRVPADMVVVMMVVIVIVVTGRMCMATFSQYSPRFAFLSDSLSDA